MLAESKLQSPHMKLLSKLEKIIYNLSKDNLDKSIQKTMKSFDSIFHFSYNLIISALVYHAFYSKNDSDDIYIDYLEGIQTKEEENDQIGQKIIDIFYNYMCKNNIKESYHLIEKMIERNLLDDDKKSKYQNSDFLLHEIKKIYHKSYKELTDDELELHKKSLKEGVNTSEIATIIRNDEIQKLQNEAIASSFDYDQKIEQSFYEKHSFINHDKVSLIDYAAFFGSIECFKYLMLNEANMNNAGKYAIAGGNLEIIYLCEKEHLTFKGAYEAAIKFHKNDIFKYVFENKLETLYEHDKDIRELGCFCIKYGNYEIFSYLEDKIKINDKVINATAKIGNLYMIKYFIQDYQVPKDILVNSIESNNIELVKYVLAQDGSDINAKYIYFINLKFYNKI